MSKEFLYLIVVAHKQRTAPCIEVGGQGHHQDYARHQ